MIEVQTHTVTYQAGSENVNIYLEQRYRVRRGHRTTIDSDEVVDNWRTTILNTLQLLPDEHVALINCGPEGEIRVWRRPSSGGGSEPREGSPEPVPHIWLSYNCFNSSFNREGHSFTLLHEMGHQVNEWRKNKRIGAKESCMRLMARTDPTGCLAILKRTHSSSGPSAGEHFANVYGDYYYHFVAQHSWRSARGVVQCTRPACTALATRLQGRASLPRSRDIPLRRIEALFNTEPFRHVQGIGAGVLGADRRSLGGGRGETVSQLRTGDPRSSSFVPAGGPRTHAKGADRHT